MYVNPSKQGNTYYDIVFTVAPDAVIHIIEQRAYFGAVTADKRNADMSDDNAPRVVTKDLYAVLTTPAVEREEMMKSLPDHLEYQVSLEERGIMFAAGPLFDQDDAPPRAGLIIIRASSFEEAKKIAMDDPMHARGLRTFTLDKWQINEGGFTLKVQFAKLTTTLD